MKTLSRLVVVLCLASAGLAGEARAGPGRSRQINDLEVKVVSVERLAHSTQLVVEVSNPGGGSFFDLADRAYPTREGVLANDLSGLRLLDVATDTEYLPLRNLDQYVCICTKLLHNEPFRDSPTITAWWRSQRLPDSVDKVSVVGPDGDVIAADVEVTG